MNAMISLLVPAFLGVDLGSVATERTANYQPPGSPGGTSTWATPASPTTARWPAAPTNIPAATPMTDNPRYNAIPTPVPTTASSSSNLPPSPFPASNSYTQPNTYTSQPSTTVPTPTMSNSGAFPGSSLGTIPSSNVPTSSMPGSSSSTTAAWPTTTAPPSMGTGPRVSQPQNWPTTPRESTISARMPAEPNLPTPNLGTIPNYNYNNYQQPTTNPYPQQNTGWGPQHVAQAGYPPSNTTSGPQFPTANPNVPPPGYVQNPQQQQNPQQNPQQQNPQQPNPQQNPGANPNLVNNPGATIAKDPAATTEKQQATNAADPLWVVLTWILLCTSMACNLYFGWSKYQMQERYRLLLVDRGAYSS